MQGGDDKATSSDDSSVSVKFFSGVLIGVQHVAFFIAIYFARFKYLHHERSIITGSLLVSMAGCAMFAVGATLKAGKEVAFSIILIARLVQGGGAGVEYTAKYVITAMSSTDMLSVYNAYWNMAAAVGSSAGPTLVAAASVLPGADGWSVGLQSAAPVLLLCVLEFALLVLHVATFPEAVTSATQAADAEKEVILISTVDRAWKIGASLFHGLVRRLVDSMWEAVVTLALEDRFGFHLSSSSLLLSLFYLSSVPAQLTFTRHRRSLTDNGWTRATCWLTAVGVALLWLGVAFPLPLVLGLSLFVIGSLLIYSGMAVLATVSDVVGVKFADPADELLNTENVILAQTLTKSFVGRSLGPVVGRLSVHGQWHGFAVMALLLLLASELLTVNVLEKEGAPSKRGRGWDVRVRLAGYQRFAPYRLVLKQLV